MNHKLKNKHVINQNKTINCPSIAEKRLLHFCRPAVETVRYAADDNDGDENYDIMKKISSTVNSRLMLTSESDALPLWLQQQLDRSIAKHLEKGFSASVNQKQY